MGCLIVVCGLCLIFVCGLRSGVCDLVVIWCVLFVMTFQEIVALPRDPVTIHRRISSPCCDLVLCVGCDLVLCMGCDLIFVLCCDLICVTLL